MSAADQLNRIVSLVAFLSRRGEGVTLDDLAAECGTTRAQVQADVRTLTGLGDHADHDWRLSLSVTQQGDAVAITSLGPWRRPLRLTPDEFLALQLALADDPEGEALARQFAGLAPRTAERPHTAHEGPRGEGRILDAVRRAVAGRVKLELLYAGAGDRVGGGRVVHPYELVVQGGRFYCIAWCEQAQGWRHFRVDRMLDALATDQPFPPRDDFEPPDHVFRTETTPDQVTVRFGPRIRRWVEERYPDGVATEDGAFQVTFDVTDPAWLVRHVLSFGTEAEVLEPEEYRALVSHG